MSERFSASVLSRWANDRLVYISTLRVGLKEQTSRLYKRYVGQEAVLSALLDASKSDKLKKVEAMRLLGSFIGKGEGEDQEAAYARSSISRGLDVPRYADSVSIDTARQQFSSIAEPNYKAALEEALEVVSANGLKTVSLKAIIMIACTSPKLP